ncbi:hypothetical protein GGS24DRAFT_344944 [Hypoxylon argillaceum]|nr:hypothetical protein GGS24DRAFT_344944 [Hypoxylon argillaceum]KAI1149362.1 hypothetical protein F4825DRAFT_54451 [Nemania diffusa]
MSASPIPTTYRLLFTTIEPLLAIAGAVQALFSPAALLRSTLPSVPYVPALAPLFTQMTGAWLALAFHDVVTLRSAAHRDDPRVWRHTLAASAVSDVFYAASLAQSMGPARFFNPLRWDAVNAAAVVATVAPFVGKLFFLAGVGLPKASASAKKATEKKTG